MYKIRLVWIWLLVPFVLQAQDVDVYQWKTNDNFVFPQRPAAMSFDEFELLSTRLRMQDMFGAALIPGYVHFKVKEKKKAWWLVGIRSAGYLGVGYLSLRNKSTLNILFNPFAKYTDKNYASDAIVAYLSAFLIAGTFLYDWFHGRWILEHKQNKIRYKYSPVLQVSRLSFAGSAGLYSVSAGIRLSF